MANILRTIFGLIANLTCIGFLIVAAFSIPQAWDLNETKYSRDDTTVYIPLEICNPTKVAIDGNAILFDTNDSDVGKCHSIEHLLNAIIASIFFAGAAVIIFLIFDFFARWNIGPNIPHSAVFGMSLFLTFSLLQCATSYLALYEECKDREDYFKRQFEKLNRTDIEDVKTYGEKGYFFVGMCLALASAVLLFLNTLIFGVCCASNNNKAKEQQQSRGAPAPAAPAPATDVEQPQQPAQQPAPTPTAGGDAVSKSGSIPFNDNIDEDQDQTYKPNTLPPWTQT